ncbi:hypothetical protein IV203_003999 [Nitzschia inconspicua]|uniref:DUF6824 domain-containing protein n=1 Tax=Nitzschia inconspicua TaxID=303405 RepID=A0A9K3PPG4_9STRA|nr:hypothetical protein IV203_003999 [Nitzschia inconspicua]
MNSKDQFNRKRQRKIAAASAFAPADSIWNNSSSNQNNIGRKSTAQPRPKLKIPPRGIGPIVDPNENDVLCGRGGRINSHSGNVKFRDIINNRKKEYLAPSTKKLEKAHIAAAIVNDIRSMDPPGRFLKEDRDTGLWFDIGDAKAIKKTGQALREDAPDIRHELEGEDSSGDEKCPPPKDTGKTSPKASPKSHRSPKTAGAATDAIWPQSNSNINNHQQHDHQAQMAMPPPSQIYSSSHHQQGSFETRNIPIPAPRNYHQPQHIVMHSNSYQLPNQLYSGARSVTSRMTSASKQAAAVLSQQPRAPVSQLPPDDIAFGRPFHPPEAANTVLSSDNTMSTISGLSENLSSNMSGGNDFRASALMNASLKSSGMARNSLRLSSLQQFRNPNSYKHGSSNDSSMGFGGMSGSFHPRGFGGESLQRSFSFNDMNSIVDGDHWKAIMEADDELIDETAAKSILSSNSFAKNSLCSGNSASRRFGARNSSAMSIGGISMDLQSNASSTQWLQAAGLGGPPPPLPSHHMSDDRTYMSNMSAELEALDLASMDPSYRI